MKFDVRKIKVEDIEHFWEEKEGGCDRLVRYEGKIIFHVTDHRCDEIKRCDNAGSEAAFNLAQTLRRRSFFYYLQNNFLLVNRTYIRCSS